MVTCELVTVVSAVEECTNIGTNVGTNVARWYEVEYESWPLGAARLAAPTPEPWANAPALF